MGKTMAEARRQHPEPSRPGPDVPIYIWFFGALGALFGGLAKPWGLAWPLAAFFGFVAAGVIAGVLNNYRIGRYILIAIGVDVIALFGAAIILEAR